MDTGHNHSLPTHTAKCDACDFVAQTHAHDEDSAVDQLSADLAQHNKSVHTEETNPESIKDVVRAKMQSA